MALANKPATGWELRNANVFTASVATLDPESYTMRVYSQSRGLSSPIEIPSGYMNARSAGPAGIHFMPEVGAECWVCETSDGTLVPLVFHGAIGADYKNKRPDLLPGDVYLGTQSKNSVSILRGGNIEIQATPVCKQFFDPGDDTIITISSNLKTHSLGSTVESLVLSSDLGARPVLTTSTYFLKAEDEGYTVSYERGTTSRLLANLDKCVDYMEVRSAPKNDPESRVVIDKLLGQNGSIQESFSSAMSTFTETVDLIGPMVNLISAATVANGLVISTGGAAGVPGTQLMSADGPEVVVGDEALAEPLILSTKFLDQLNLSMSTVAAVAYALQAIVTALGQQATVDAALGPYGISINGGDVMTLKQEISSKTYLAAKIKSE